MNGEHKTKCAVYPGEMERYMQETVLVDDHEARNCFVGVKICDLLAGLGGTWKGKPTGLSTSLPSPE